MYMNINIKYILISVVAGANYNLYDVWDTEPELELVTCAARAPPSLPPPPTFSAPGGLSHGARANNRWSGFPIILL